MSLVASPHNPDVLWAGSDDGLIHITRDGGETWINSTPKGLKEGIINSIEVSPHNPETAYAVVMRYKFMDLNPYIYKTEDYGENWDLITDGIEGEHNFVRVVREDPKVPGLLYAGTETGFYISLNDGEYWEPFQNNLPIVPINDLYIQDNDLIAATAGRSFWILDDLSAIQQSPKDISVHLVTPKKSYRLSSGKTPKNSTQGTNPMSGVYLDYYLAEVHDSLEVKIDILQGDQIIRSYTSQKDSLFKSWPGGPSPKTVLKNKKGFNRTHWDFRREQLPSVDKVFVYGSYEGSLVAPGMYSAKLTYGEEVKKVDIEILPNPNMHYSAVDFEAQQNLLVKIEKAIKKIHYSVSEMRDVQDQLNHYLKILNGKEEYNVIYGQALAIKKRLNEWETKLIQPNQKTFQDVINFNNMLNAQFMHLKAFIDADDPELTQGAKQRYKDLIVIWSKYKTELDQIIDNDFKAFEKNYREAQVPLIMVNLNSK